MIYADGEGAETTMRDDGDVADPEERYWHPAGMALAALAGCLIAVLIILLGAVMATRLVGVIIAGAMVGAVLLAIAMLMPHRVRYRIHRPGTASR